MAFKINISGKDGKTYYLEVETEYFVDKSLGEKAEGKEFYPALEGYEFKITGASDKAGLPALEEVEGIALKRVLLGYGKGMHMRPKGLSKKPNKKPAGLRLRKTIRGKTISLAISQINLSVLKEGKTKLAEVFPEQNKKKEEKAEPAATA